MAESDRLLRRLRLTVEFLRDTYRLAEAEGDKFSMDACKASGQALNLAVEERAKGRSDDVPFPTAAEAAELRRDPQTVV